MKQQGLRLCGAQVRRRNCPLRASASLSNHNDSRAWCAAAVMQPWQALAPLGTDLAAQARVPISGPLQVHQAPGHTRGGVERLAEPARVIGVASRPLTISNASVTAGAMDPVVRPSEPPPPPSSASPVAPTSPTPTLPFFPLPNHILYFGIPCSTPVKLMDSDRDQSAGEKSPSGWPVEWRVWTTQCPPLPKVQRLVQEHLLLGQLIGGQQTAQGTNGGLEEGHLQV